jgi:transposase
MPETSQSLPEMSPPERRLAVCIGIDWATDHHDIAWQAHAEAPVTHRRVAHSPEALTAWLTDLRQHFPDGALGIAVETSRGPLVHALLEHPDVVLYPINPRSLKRFRETFALSGAKADQPDAELLMTLLVTHRAKLRAWVPADPAVRTLRRLVEQRRRAVDARTQLVQQLMAALQEYYPQALEWAGDDLSAPMARAFLQQWPTLAAVQRARRTTLRHFYTRHNCRAAAKIDARLSAIADAAPLTRDPAIIEPSVLLVRLLVAQLDALAPHIAHVDAEIATRFAAHPDAALFEALPGSGAALAPRLLAAFGADRTRFASASDMQQLAGIAPVTKRSGRTCLVHWRWAVPTFLRQTFHEFAQQSVRWSPWARAYYAQQRARGHAKHAAFRALAFKWIRIIWRCWQDRTPYNEARYTRAQHLRGAPLASHLPIPVAA